MAETACEVSDYAGDEDAAMTPADIIRMAREADMGFDFTAPGLIAELERFAALVAAAEREACEKECERIAAAAWDLWEQAADTNARSNAVGALACLEVIRARGTP